MSIKDHNKEIIISSALTGKVVQIINFDDYNVFRSARDFTTEKILQLVDNEEGAIVKIGIKG